MAKKTGVASATRSPLEWIRWARSQRLKGPAQAVLVVLATYVDASGEAWPSITTLALDAGVCRRSAATALRRLADAGLVADTGRTVSGVKVRRLTGGCTSCTSAPPALVHQVHGGAPPARGGCTSCTGGVQEVHTEEPVEEPVEEPPPLTPPPAGGDQCREGSVTAVVRQLVSRWLADGQLTGEDWCALADGSEAAARKLMALSTPRDFDGSPLALSLSGRVRDWQRAMVVVADELGAVSSTRQASTTTATPSGELTTGV